jgi:hypothetical protein
MITSNIAAQVVISNIARNARCGGGGGNEPPDDTDWGFLLALFTPVILLIVVLIWVVVDTVLTDRLPDYEVAGKVVAYSHETPGKSKKVFVHLVQTDSVVRKYNTDIKPEYCRKAPAGTQIPVIVSPSYSRLTSTTHYTSNLKYNPCK